jgi:hypothetical protein
VIRTANETGKIALVCGHDALVGEHLGRARHDLEQLTGAGVQEDLAAIVASKTEVLNG